MANENGKIYDNVSDYDVRQVLGEVSGDLGELCTSENINIWALNKPVRHHKMFASITEQDWQQGANTTESALDDTTCGLSVGTAFDSVVKKANIITTDENGFTKADISSDTECFLYNLAKGTTGHWEYLRPQGLEAASPYRIDDFRGYDHYAINPMPKVSTKNLTDGVFYFSNEVIDFSFDVPNISLEDSLTNVTLDTLKLPASIEVMSLNEMYWGMLLYSEDLKDCMWVTQTEEQKNKGAKVVAFAQNERCTIANRRGKYKARAFFSSKPLETNAIVMSSDGRTSLLSALSDPIDVILLPQGSKILSITLERKQIKDNEYYPQIRIENNTPATIAVTEVVFNDGGFNMALDSSTPLKSIEPFKSEVFRGSLYISNPTAYFKVKVVAGGKTYENLEFNGQKVTYEV